MNGLISAVYSLLKNRGTFFQEFKESGTFIAPKTGWYEIDGCGGGASGALSQSYSGGAGAGCQSYRVYLIKGESVPVTIGAGGVWVSGEVTAPGGDTIFGPTELGFKIILPGASGLSGGLNRLYGSSWPWLNDAHNMGFLIAGANGGYTSNLHPGWSTFKSGMPSGGNYFGGAGGFYGPGGDSNGSGKGQSAAANSGAGGGSGSTGGGNGGSGRIRIREAC